MKKRILIEGMSCGHCVNHVREALGDISGVKDVTVDLTDKTAVIQSDSEISNDEIKSIIEEVGYDVVGIEKI